MDYQHFFSPIRSILADGRCQSWADLGCGTGVFTKLLAESLPAKSHIIAVDKNKPSLPNLYGHDISITQRVADFETDVTYLNQLDGILMANSLHYVRDKDEFIEKIQPCLHTRHRLIVVEYDTQNANNWVPFPVDFRSLQKLFHQHGYQNVTRLKSKTSSFGGYMYLAHIS